MIEKEPSSNYENTGNHQSIKTSMVNTSSTGNAQQTASTSSLSSSSANVNSGSNNANNTNVANVGQVIEPSFQIIPYNEDTIHKV